MSISYSLSGAWKHTMLSLILWFPAALLGHAEIAAAATTAAFLMREITQAEYKWIANYGAGKRANMKWHKGFTDPRVWDRKSLLDWLVPAVLIWALTIWNNLNPIF